MYYNDMFLAENRGLPVKEQQYQPSCPTTSRLTPQVGEALRTGGVKLLMCRCYGNNLFLLNGNAVGVYPSACLCY